jgi:hypothetical protein
VRIIQPVTFFVTFSLLTELNRRMNLRAFLLITLLTSISFFQSYSAGKLVISEFLAVNTTILQDEDKEFSNWIEIQNTGDSNESLKGKLSEPGICQTKR